MSDNRAGLQGPAPDERPHPDGRRNAQNTRTDPRAESGHKSRRAAFSAIVKDEPGVLPRAAGLAARCQFNIGSLTVDPTTVEDHSRIMMVVEGPEPGIDQIEKQLAGLKPVISIGELDDDAVRAEFVLLRARGEDPDKVHAITEMYDGCTLDASPKTTTVQLTGNGRKINGAVDTFRRFGVIETARTGQTALTHGPKKTVPEEGPGASGEPTKPSTDTQ